MNAPALIRQLGEAFSDDETARYAVELAVRATGQPTHAADLGGGLALAVFVDGGEATWTVRSGAGLVGAGALEDDFEFAEETGAEAAWVERAAFVVPGWQRRGVYSRVLPELRRVFGHVYPDTQQSPGAVAAWQKAGMAEG